jgi:hypothetical protein
LIVIFFNKDPNKTFFDFIFIDSIKLPLTYKLMLFKLYSSYGFLDKYNKVESAYTILLIEKDSSLYDLQKKIFSKFISIINTGDIKKMI